jgi:putative SOS response-associated peptidase YedK
VEFSIITKEAYGDLSSIHHRAPLILNSKEQAIWISQTDENSLYEDISNQNEIPITFHRVNKSVNNPKNKNSSLIKEYTEVPF